MPLAFAISSKIQDGLERSKSRAAPRPDAGHGLTVQRSRRGFMLGTTLLWVGACHEGGEAEVTPGEDLMQEHGVVERVLLIYEEAARRITQNEALDTALVSRAAAIVKRFVEQYHEQNEERFIFPRLEAAKREVDLVATLRQQHERGRVLTAEIADLSMRAASPELLRALGAFGRMYLPHAAREDTVLFPAFREVVGRSAYHELGEQFEDDEHARFGERGFEKVVAEVADIERGLGIDDLKRVTP